MLCRICFRLHRSCFISSNRIIWLPAIVILPITTQHRRLPGVFTSRIKLTSRCQLNQGRNITGPRFCQHSSQQRFHHLLAIRLICVGTGNVQFWNAVQGRHIFHCIRKTRLLVIVSVFRLTAILLPTCNICITRLWMFRSVQTSVDCWVFIGNPAVSLLLWGIEIISCTTNADTLVSHS